MKIIIAGAGIAGLATAIGLAKHNHEVVVLERRAQISELGAGIQCGANALWVLHYLGIKGELESLASQPQGVEFKDGITGSTLYRMTVDQNYEQKFGQPYWHVHRADLLNALVTQCRNNPNIRIHTSTKVVAYQHLNHQVRVETQDCEFTADALLACDGIRSNIRNIMFGDTGIIETNSYAWRGVVHADNLDCELNSSLGLNFMGYRQHMVIYPLRGGKLLNFVGVVEGKPERNLEFEPWGSVAPKNDLLNDFAGWHDSLQSVLLALDETQCFKWPLLYHSPLSKWVDKNVALVGDAAHSMLPYMASGAAMALEDACVLSRCFEGVSDRQAVETSLQRYERNRLNRANKVQRASTQAGKLYHVPSGLFRSMAFNLIQLGIGPQHRYLPSYNASTIRLL